MRIDIAEGYKAEAKRLYFEYRMLSPDQIRIEIMRVYTDIIAQKSIERLNRKVRKPKVNKKITLEAKELSF